MAYVVLAPLLFLALPKNIARMVIIFAIYLVIGTIINRQNKRKIADYLRINHPKSAILISLLLGERFFFRWTQSNKILAIIETLHLPFSIEVPAGMITICGTALSVYGVDVIISFLSDYFLTRTGKTTQSERTHSVITGRDYIYLLVVAIITMTICTESSPLYPFNSWVDSNAFFTVGKSMLGGLVPYKDLFEHKGPLLFVIHAGAAFISYNSFIGIYIFEVISCFAFLLCCFHILRIYFDANVILMIPVISAAVYTADCFCHGDSVEEFCLPLLAYGLLVSVRALRENQLPSNKTCFMIGVTSACVLWMKFTILGFYLGWIIAPVYLAIKQRKYIDILKKIGVIVLGVVAVTIPFVVYFSLHGAIVDWFEVYFYDNIFVYTAPQKSSLLRTCIHILINLLNVLNGLWASNAIMLAFVAAGIIWCVFLKENLVALHLACSFTGTIISTYIGGRNYIYYALIFRAFIVFGFVWILESLNYMTARGLFRFRIDNMSLALLCIFAVVTFVLCPNTHWLKYKKDDLPQFRVKSIISQSGRDNPSLLNYGCLDGGFYTVTAIQPNFKYFYHPNMPLPIIMNQQNYYVQNGLADFVITDHELPGLNLYNYIDKYSYFYEGREMTYYLYELKNG